MVDFNNEATIGTPAVDVVRILILQRRSDFIEALERYNKMEYQNTSPDISIVKARLVSLFLELQAGLKRRLKKESYTELMAKVYHEDMAQVLEAFNYLNEYLDDIRLTRLDNRPKADKTKWEDVNKAYGY